MSKIIRITSVKGGVGKSTIAAFMAKYLSERGNVLVIDLDNLGRLSTLIEILRLKDVEVRRELIDLDKLRKMSGYDYVIIDNCELTKVIEDPSQDIINVVISDVLALASTLEYLDKIDGVKVLIVNMVPPLPADFSKIIKAVSELNVDLKAVIPFIPKIFSLLVRQDSKTELPIVKRLAIAIENNEFNGEVITR
ncbi:MAG: ParA family protein [Metallosphaera sp.]|uniref:ParA family protein n=1 Tax=Metallosphaera sp. TaxID=2020860 RepID=UPI00315E74F2